ncbi:putative kinesin light chain [Phaeomoniella chlamydospora]|uniref:Putative kinesin light chain n=1 Tax=Phaeomoniella chlamydospora TaxID=158046 RepID=A0A0G2E1F7_PHACM|nr:putative kinesin light chain [Phaeomoniella chlamydospora]
MQTITQLKVQQYSVAIVCPLAIELSAVRLMLDARHQTPYFDTKDDDNHYTCGSMFGHNVVIVNLPQWKNGLISASHLVNPLHRTFPNVQVTLLVGIGGGLPSIKPLQQPNENIRLGDVVIGWDGDKSQAIVQWNGGRKGRILPQPDRRILNILTKMESNQQLGEAKLHEHLKRCTNAMFSFPGRQYDRLYETSYSHTSTQDTSCANCDPVHAISRASRKTNDFQLHLGPIVSVEHVVTTAETRDRIRDETHALCIEMEAAGILERKNCLVIRGISDYADSHKNDVWKPYAAATAASVAREFLSIMPPGEAPLQLQLAGHVPSSTSSIVQNEHYLIPRDPTSQFTGREKLLEQIRESYFPANARPSSSQRRYVIHGEGGRGKTELCLKFAEQNRELFWGIFWVDASSRRSIERGFATIAKDCKVEQDVDMVKRWLSNRPRVWLLIFDNADDMKLNLSRYFPVGDRGMILITTRDNNACTYATVGHHELGQLAMGDAVTLLLKTIGPAITTNVSDSSRQTHAQAVVASYECSPLAIANVGAVIRNSSYTIEQYINKHIEPGQKSSSNVNSQSDGKHHRKASTSWEVSMEMMEGTPGNAGKDAVDLLHIFSFFDYNGISEKILERSCEGRESTADLHRILTYRKRRLSRPRSYEWSPDRFNQAVATLSNFSLISRDKENLISIHPLVHNWARDRARTRLGPVMAEKLWTVALYTLGASISWSFTTEEYLYRRWIIPHIQSCLEATDYRRIFEDDKSNPEWLRILEKLALAYAENYRRQEAVNLLRGVVIVRRKLLGNSHFETLRAMNSLANSYSSIGDYNEALRMTEMVVEEREKTLGGNHRDTLSSKYNLAVRFGDIGRPKEALKRLEDVLATQEATLGGNDPDALRSMNSLANYYGETGQCDLARQLAELVLRDRTNALGGYHPETLGTMHNLAIWKGKVGQNEEALALMEKAVQRRKVTLSKEHPDTLRSMFSLSLYYQEMGRTADAWRVMESVAEARKRILGKTHPDTKKSYQTLTFFAQLLRMNMREKDAVE